MRRIAAFGLHAAALFALLACASETCRAQLAAAVAFSPEAFRGKIPDLRQTSKACALSEYQNFAWSLESKVKLPDECHKGPAAVDYIPWGNNVYSDESLEKYVSSMD